MGSIISVLKIGIAYFESEWSFAQFRIPKEEKENYVSFLQNNYNIIVLTKNGKLYITSFEPKLGGECKRVDGKNITKKNENIKIINNFN